MAQKTIIFNAVILSVRTLLQIAVGILTSRLVFQALGIDGFGVFSVVMALVLLGEFACQSMRTTSMRYFADMGQLPFVTLATLKMFAIRIVAKIAIIGLIIGLPVTIFCLNLPAGTMGEAVLVFAASFVAYCIRFCTMPLEGATLCLQRGPRQVTLIEICALLLRLGAASALWWYPRIGMATYAAMLLIVSVATYINYRRTLRHIAKAKSDAALGARIKKTFFSDLAGTASTSIYQYGTPIAINLFFGVAYNAAVALGQSLVNAVTGLQHSLSQAILPHIYGAHKTRIWVAPLFVTIALAVVIVPACILMPWILRLWLGSVPEHAVVFGRLMLLAVLAQAPCRAIIEATYVHNDNKRLNIATGILMGIVPFVSVICFVCGATAYVAYGIAIGTALFASIGAIAIIVSRGHREAN